MSASLLSIIGNKRNEAQLIHKTCPVVQKLKSKSNKKMFSRRPATCRQNFHLVSMEFLKWKVFFASLLAFSCPNTKHLTSCNFFLRPFTKQIPTNSVDFLRESHKVRAAREIIVWVSSRESKRHLSTSSKTGVGFATQPPNYCFMNRDKSLSSVCCFFFFFGWSHVWIYLF